MESSLDAVDRRDVIRFGGGILALITGSSMLGGCGGGSDAKSTVVTITPATGVGTDSAAAPVVADAATSWLNLGLAIQYVGAQFYSLASSGAGLSSALQGGVGVQGQLKGGRGVNFADPNLLAYATEIAADKVSTLSDLRAKLGASAGAQPAIDLSSTSFRGVAQAAGLGSGFDPFADDRNFLIAALMVEYVGAAAFRAMLTQNVAPAAVDLLTAALRDANYHSGLIRSLLMAKGDTDPTLASATTAVLARLAELGGSGTSAREPLSIAQASSDLSDSSGMLIPLTRTADEVLSLLYLSDTGTAGGFLPSGINGVHVLPGVN